MRALKKAVKKVISFGGDLRYWGNYKKICIANAGKKPLLIVDIDNTIADTQKFERAHPGQKILVRELEPLIKTRQWLLTMSESHVVIYLTARNYWQHALTVNWLQQHGFPFQKNHIVLVPGASDKLRYLKYSCLHGKDILYIDDLSYLDERGEVRMYHALITEVKKLPIQYLDLSFIQGL